MICEAIVNAPDHDGSATHRLVSEYSCPNPAQQRRYGCRIIPMIMIPKHCDDAKRGAEASERSNSLHSAIDLTERFSVTHIVTCEDDQIRSRGETYSREE